MVHTIRSRWRAAVLGLLLAAVLLPGRARAQDLPALSIDVARPLAAPQETLMMLDRGGAPLPWLAPRFSLAIAGGHHVVLYTGERDHTVSLDESLVAVAGAALGLGFADVGVAFPVHLVLLGHTDAVPWTETAVGDLVLVPRVALIPLAESPVQVLLSAPVTFPTGKAERFAGRAGLSAEPRVRVGVHAGRVHVAVRPGLLFQGGRAVAGDAALGNAGTLRAAVGVGIGPGQWLRPELGADGVMPLGDPSLASAELLIGAVVRPVGGLRISLHGGFGFGQLPGFPASRVIGAVAWELPQGVGEGGP